jgi:hypothetical protein
MLYIDIIESLERALGTSLDSDRRESVMNNLARDLGGETHYFPSLVKLQRRKIIESFGTSLIGLSQKQLSQRIGIPVRTIQRLKNGR